MDKPRVLVLSLGGTPDPVIFSINHNRPDSVILFCSQQSLDMVPEVFKGIDYGLDRRNLRTLITDDPDDLIECFKVAEDLFVDLFKNSYKRSHVLVDYTGGTKNMTAALTLASARFGVNYFYVGGEERTKDGLGVVVSGLEEVRDCLNPWVFFAVEEKRKIAQLFNNCQFNAAVLLIDEILDRLDKNTRTIYQRLREIILGFDYWDHFKYRQAFQHLTLEKVEAFSDLARFAGEDRFCDFAKACMKPAGKLASINGNREDHPEALKIYDVVYDVIANAARRAELGNYDDAVLRLYRALEMIGQVELDKKAIDDSNIDLSDSGLGYLGKEWLKKKFPEQSHFKLGLNDKFGLLAAMGIEKGINYREIEKKFQKVLLDRNESFLAHGFRVLSREEYERFKKLLYDFLDSNVESTLCRFPRMEL